MRNLPGKLFPLAIVTLLGSVLYVLANWNTETVDDPAPGMPASGDPDFRFHEFSPWQAVIVPPATGFAMPMGSANGALVYNAQPFWSLNPKRGGHHTGDDLNGIGGMNTDLGDPVFAVADGLVVYAAQPSHGWGKIVIISHRMTDGRSIQSMYAHLDTFVVKPGELVARGQKIATVGTGNDNYLAHLHLEMRESAGVDLGSGYSLYPFNHLSPTRVIRENPAHAPDRPAPSVFRLVLAEGNPPADE